MKQDKIELLEYFPENMQPSEQSKVVSSLLYGHRFHSDQTLYEYLIEFLLIFCSEKPMNSTDGKMRFHDPENSESWKYTVEPRMGLRRFVFFDKCKKQETVEVDEKAYKRLMTALCKKMEDTEEDEAVNYLAYLQDLFYGYAVVIKKRSWCAQAMLPICPEVVFCEAMPEIKKRIHLQKIIDENPQKKNLIDKGFEFTKRNFLARGGEIYYLHILQGLRGKKSEREQLEKLLNYLLVSQGKKMSKIASFIQEVWEEEMDYAEKIKASFTLSYIPARAYNDIADNSIEELICFLSCNMHPVRKIDLMAKGVMLQIMRMMLRQTTKYINQDKSCWIIDMGGSASEIIKKIAAASFQKIEEDFMTALNKMALEVYDREDELDLVDAVRKARIDSLDVFRAKGKELQCIIPASGPYERFTLSEDITRFLVLSLIKPGEKMTFDMFLQKLYNRYWMVIGPVEYKEAYSDSNDVSLTNCFNENASAFQAFLKATGFLRELSDATSIVINPYEMILEEQGDAVYY